MEKELMNQYLCALENELVSFTTAEKKEIIYDVRNQIKEKQFVSNLPISVILNSFGSPKELAKSYGCTKTSSYSPKNMMETYAYYGSSGLYRSKK